VIVRNVKIPIALVTGVLAMVAASSAPAADLAVRAGIVHTVVGEPIADGVVLIEGGKILRVGPESDVAIPAGTRVIEAAEFTPRLVDARTVVGLAGIYNSSRGQVQDQDQIETSSPIQPELRAIDAYDAVEPLVSWVRSLGVTTIHTGHGPGAIVSGQTLIAKTHGETVEEAAIREVAAVAADLGPSVARNFDSPGTRPKGAAMLRAALVEAQAYRERRDGDDPPDRDLGQDVLADVLAGDVALVLTAHDATDIATALRLQREFGFRLWLDGAAEAYRMIEPIRSAGVPVLLHPTMTRAGGEARNAAFTTAARLAEAGIPFAIQSGFESYVPKARVLLYEAQVAVWAGLPRDAALRAITLEPARILGVDDRVGSIEAGKDADLVLFDGDPFEYTSHACTVLIDGEVVSDTCR
jgi:imidazolonepropionase-like amidohydrolase